MMWLCRSLLYRRGSRVIGAGGGVWGWRTATGGAPVVSAYVPRGALTGTW